MFNSHEPILDQIAKKDRFLSYPYESIKPFLTMLHEAANDEDVVSIKMTLYRVAKQSKVVEALIEAARVFQALAMGETVENMEHLLVVPKCLQNKVLAMIDEEIEHARAGEQAYDNAAPVVMEK